MDPFTFGVTVEGVQLVLGVLLESRKHVSNLLDAVRGAKDERSMWYSLCKELGDHCGHIAPQLAALETEVRRGELPKSTLNTTQDVIQMLNGALHDATALVGKCQSSRTVTLYLRGSELKKSFKQVAERISRSLSSIPLVSLGSNLATQRSVKETAERLRTARFELSEEDRALIRDVHDAVMKRSDRQEELLQKVLDKLDMTQLSASDVSDERRELNAPDMEAKERTYLEQICTLLESTALAAPAAPPAAGCSRSTSIRLAKLPETFNCCITLELMEDPVIDCLGHTYERRAIENALRHRPGFCPYTNERYPGGDARLHTNLALRHTIEAMVPLTERPAHDVHDGGGRERPRGDAKPAAAPDVAALEAAGDCAPLVELLRLGDAAGKKTAAAAEAKAKRNYTCSICHAPGHNRTTCSQRR